MLRYILMSRVYNTSYVTTELLTKPFFPKPNQALTKLNQTGTAGHVSNTTNVKRQKSPFLHV